MRRVLARTRHKTTSDPIASHCYNVRMAKRELYSSMVECQDCGCKITLKLSELENPAISDGILDTRIEGVEGGFLDERRNPRCNCGADLS